MENFALYSYLIASIAFGGLSILSLWKVSKYSTNLSFTIAAISSFLWAGYTTYVLYSDDVYTTTIFPLETLRNVTWYYFLLTMIYSHKEQGNKVSLIEQSMWHSKYVLILAVYCLLVLIIELFPALLYLINQFSPVDFRLSAGVGFAVIGLILVEQLYRNTQAENRWMIKFICFGLGAVFVYDLIIYSKSMLFSDIDNTLWNLRGVINSMIVPLLVISLIRLQEDISHNYTISRTIVFHTTTLVGSGLYLILMSLAGYYIKIYGGSWGEFAQVLFVFFGILLLVILLFSGSIRAMAKVYFNKHFFQYNYDYRDEWIKLSRQIAELNSFNELSYLIIKSLADLVDSSGGGLWIKNDRNDFFLSERMSLGFDNMPVIYADNPVVEFIKEKQWVVDLFEYEENPEIYDNLDFSSLMDEDKNIWLIIPLLQQSELKAFVILTKPRVNRSLNWEDHDLLKTVGMQLANALGLSQTSEALSTARQFEAYSRLSAFIVHDLKNLVAQVSLIVKNAEKHKHNPEFIDDAIETLENVVFKMQNLVGQLRKRNIDDKKTTVNLIHIITDVVKLQSTNRPVPEFSTNLSYCLILAEQEKISAILGHLIQNAQDATSNDGFIKIALTQYEQNAIIIISDNGTGMDEKFIAERLFKPFDTTKGNAGMGIGVYEAKNYILNHSGKVSVNSEINKGTTFTIEFPMLKTEFQNNEECDVTPIFFSGNS